MILLLALLWAPFSTAVMVEEHGVGNGGDGMTLEFLDTAQALGRSFAGMNEACRKALPFPLGDFRAKVGAVTVESTLNPLLLRGKAVEAINFPEENRILFHRDSWARKDEAVRSQLVLHEFLGLLGVSDTFYASSMRSMLLVGDPLCSPENQKVADAGATQDSYRPGPVKLNGKANLPGEGYQVRWELVSGPEGARVLEPGSLDTTVELPSYGEYELRFSVHSPKWGDFSDITRIRVSKPEPFNCEREYALPERGYLEMKVNDILPLCGGWAYIARGDTSVVELRNLITRQVAEEFHVGSYPEKLEFQGKDLIVQTSSSHIYRIRPGAKEAEVFPYLAHPNGKVFLVGKYFLEVTDYHLALFEADTGKFLREIENPGFDQRVAYNPVLRKLYGVEYEKGLVQYSLELPRLKLRKEKVVDEYGGNTTNVLLSPDGRSLVVLSDVMNSGGGLRHYNAKNVSEIMGVWPVNGFGRDGAFSQDGRYFAVLGNSGARVFSVTDNNLVEEIGVPDRFSYSKALVRLSRDGKILLAAYQNEDWRRLSDNKSLLVWMKTKGP